MAIYNKSVEPANKESEKTNQNSPLQAAIYEIITGCQWRMLSLDFPK